ncbi:MAG: cation-translocating P-type ATPase [Bdellovibrionaceae bacterium]|nr:cation-translocating P-type ATPase [Pseudobdellovibrionaceae bacterium]
MIVVGGVAAFLAFSIGWMRGGPTGGSGAFLAVMVVLGFLQRMEKFILSKMASAALFQLHRDAGEIAVFREDEWTTVPLEDIRAGDRIRVLAGMTVPFDGQLSEARAEINRHLLTGDGTPTLLSRGDEVLAGSIASVDFEILVEAPIGHRRIDQWASQTLIGRRDRAAFFVHGLERIETAWVLLMLVGAFLFAVVQLSRSASLGAAVDSFFRMMLVVGPFLFLSTLSVSRRMASLALYHVGVFVSDVDSLFRLKRSENFYFDKTGTLESVSSRFEPFTQVPVVEHLLSDLALVNSHPVLRGLKTLPPSESVNVVEEIPAKGVRALTKEGGELLVGRPSYLRAHQILLPAHSGNLFPLVAYNGEVVGQIITKKTYDRRSKAFLKNLLKWNDRIRIEILSGDPDPEAGRFLKDLSPRIRYSGNLTPAEKAERIHRRSVFVGDGLNDTLALREADVSFLMGHRISGVLPVDFHVYLPNINLVLATLSSAALFRKVVIQNLFLSFVYNLLVLVAALAGVLSALTASLALILTFALSVFSSRRLLKSPEVPR